MLVRNDTCNQVPGGLPPPCHFPLGFRLTVISASHGATRHAWRTKRKSGTLFEESRFRNSLIYLRLSNAPSGTRTPNFLITSFGKPIPRGLVSRQECLGVWDLGGSPDSGGALRIGE
jgi:hypothetical protein